MCVFRSLAPVRRPSGLDALVCTREEQAAMLAVVEGAA